MDNPMLAWVVIGIGALLVLIALFADPLGLGGQSGFGWKQGLGLVIGAVVILAGLSAASGEGLYVGTATRAPEGTRTPDPRLRSAFKRGRLG